MLKELSIQNIALIESAIISFCAGFSVLSGETGAGKSAVMEALSVVLGKRAHAALLRHGTSKACIEAKFDIQQLPDVLQFLHASEIEHTAGEPLLLRREIMASGKNRSFANDQLVSTSLIQQISEYLIAICGQHASQQLFSLSQQRNFVDIFGVLQKHVLHFGTLWQEHKEKSIQLQSLTQNQAQQNRDFDMYSRQIEEIDEVQLKSGQEEELFAEYTRLAHAEELSVKIGSICDKLSEGTTPALPVLNRCKVELANLKNIDPKLDDSFDLLQHALVELQEASYNLRNYHQHIEISPERLSEIDQRLHRITQLKKKYGSTVEEIIAYRNQTEQQLQKLQNCDWEKEQLEKVVVDLTLKCTAAANQLTEQRVEAAKVLSTAITQELAALNMKNAKLQIQVSVQEMALSGQDQIEFFLQANKGERVLPLRDCASGGELSRIMLALQTVLSGKEQCPTIVFDEIDANIGGETAAIIGQKINAIANNHQIICITHLPQVAYQAVHHIHVRKVESQERTFTEVVVLNKNSRKAELARLMGGEQFNKATKDFAAKVLSKPS